MAQRHVGAAVAGEPWACLDVCAREGLAPGFVNSALSVLRVRSVGPRDAREAAASLPSWVRHHPWV